MAQVEDKVRRRLVKHLSNGSDAGKRNRQIECLIDWIVEHLDLDDLRVRRDIDGFLSMMGSGIVLCRLMRLVDPDLGEFWNVSAVEGTVRAQQNLIAFSCFWKEYQKRKDLRPVIDFPFNVFVNSRTIGDIDQFISIIRILIQQTEVYGYFPLQSENQNEFLSVDYQSHRRGAINRPIESPWTAGRGPRLMSDTSILESDDGGEIPPFDLIEADLDSKSDGESKDLNDLPFLDFNSKEFNDSMRTDLEETRRVKWMLNDSHILRVPLPAISDIHRKLLIALRESNDISPLLCFAEKSLHSSSIVPIDDEPSNYITDIQVLHTRRGDALPEGYVLLEKSVEGMSANLNSGSPGKDIYLCYKCDPNGIPITDISIAPLKSSEISLSSFERVDRSPSGLPGDLNLGSGESPIYLWIRRGTGAPIVDLKVSRNIHSLTYPFKMLQLGGDGKNAFLNNKPKMRLCYRKSLWSYFEISRESCFTTEETNESMQDVYHSNLLNCILLCCHGRSELDVWRGLQTFSILTSRLEVYIPPKPLNNFLYQLLESTFSLYSSFGKGRNLHRLAVQVAWKSIVYFMSDVKVKPLLKLLQTCEIFGKVERAMFVTDSIVEAVLRLECDEEGEDFSIRHFVSEFVEDLVDAIEMGEAMDELVDLSSFDVVAEELVDKIVGECGFGCSRYLAVLLFVSKQCAMGSFNAFSHLKSLLSKPLHFLKSSLCVFHFKRFSLALRRCVVPDLIKSFGAQFSSMGFQSLLDILFLLLDGFNSICRLEMGIFMEHLLIPSMKTSEHPAFTSIIRFFSRLMETKDRLCLLFHNYDNTFNRYQELPPSRVVLPLTEALGVSESTPETVQCMEHLVNNLKESLSEAKETVQPIVVKSDLRAECPLKSRRASSWRVRFKDKRSKNEAMEKALEITYNCSLIHGIRHVFLTSRAFDLNGHKEIAHFLLCNDRIDPWEVGRVLESEEDEVFTREDFQLVRRCFSHFIDFSGMDVLQALRNFVQCLGFHLPTKRINLLRLFAHCYARDHYELMLSEDSLVKVAEVILETDKQLQSLNHVGDLRESFMEKISKCRFQVQPSEIVELFDELSASPLSVYDSESKINVLLETERRCRFSVSLLRLDPLVCPNWRVLSSNSIGFAVAVSVKSALKLVCQKYADNGRVMSDAVVLSAVKTFQGIVQIYKSLGRPTEVKSMGIGENGLSWVKESSVAFIKAVLKRKGMKTALKEDLTESNDISRIQRELDHLQGLCSTSHFRSIAKGIDVSQLVLLKEGTMYWVERGKDVSVQLYESHICVGPGSILSRPLVLSVSLVSAFYMPPDTVVLGGSGKKVSLRAFSQDVKVWTDLIQRRIAQSLKRYKNVPGHCCNCLKAFGMWTRSSTCVECGFLYCHDCTTVNSQCVLCNR